jgi:hypothetical protein
LQQTAKTMCMHTAEEADVKAREKILEVFYNSL